MKPKLIPTKEQVTRILEYHTGEARLFLELMVDTGGRPGEILRMTKDDVQDCAVILKTRKKKGGNLVPRRVTINMVLWLWLQEYLVEWSDYRKYLFQQKKQQTPRRNEWAIELLRRACKKIGFPYFGPNTIRHYHAKKLIEKGVPLDTIRERLGHESTATTERYLKEIRRKGV